MRTAKPRFAIVAVAALVALPRASSAFDTVWHNAASSGAGQQHGFTADAINVMQFGTFGPDFFGPVYEYTGGATTQNALNAFSKLRANTPTVLTAAIYLHFDNIDAALDRNWKLDYLFRRLLANTQSAIKTFHNDSSLADGTRKLLVLITLGASLHAIEDFYSHSNWVHNNFVDLGFPQQKSVWKQDYAPSWFQFVERFGLPALDGKETWPIHVQSGVYKPKQPFTLTDSFGQPLNHSNMQHDNSQISDEGVSQATHHHFGAHPANANDDASATAHHLYAVNTAAMAAIEWVSLVEKDPDAKAAIDGARTLKVSNANVLVVGSLESALADVLFLSCTVDHWNGKHPPKNHVAQCSVKHKLQAFASLMAAPYWSAFLKNGVLEKLVVGLGDASSHYTFDETWYGAHRAPDTTTTTTTTKVIHLPPLDLVVHVPPDATVKSTTATKVVITSPQLGELVIEVAQPQPPPPPPSPDPPQPPPADPQNYERIYRVPSTSSFKVIGQRTFGTHTYACGGTGTDAQAKAIVDTCNNLASK